MCIPLYVYIMCGGWICVGVYVCVCACMYDNGVYRISSNRMRALYLFQCFDIACIIQGCFVFEGALYFLPMKCYPEISLN